MPSESAHTVRNAAIYARVSTADQETQNQLTEMREFAQLQDWEIAGEYLDQEKGETANRAQFQRLFEDLPKDDLTLFCSGLWTASVARERSPPFNISTA